MKNRQKLLILAAVLLLLAGGGWFLYASGFFQAARSLDGLRAYIVHFAPYSHLAFFLVQLLSVILAPIPSNVTAAAGGVLFGTWPAFLITYGAVAAGSLLVFWLARALGDNSLGDGPHRTGRAGPVPAGDEVWRQVGRICPQPFKGAETWQD